MEKNKENKNSKNILIGNSFPIGLVERKISIQPANLDELKNAVQSANKIFSFWGHEETLDVASKLLGKDIRPSSERPALQINQEGYPMLYGEIFKECWILAPVYIKGYRPKPGEIPDSTKIERWKSLKINFEA